MKVAILAGGLGTRLWPLSTDETPKQFIKFDFLDNKSLIEKTFERALKLVSSKDIYFVVSKGLKEKIISVLPGVNKNNILEEPERKNTLPAITFAMSKLKDTVLFLPSDHYIENEDVFVEYVKVGLRYCDNYLVIFGIKPTHPATGYGYIKHRNGHVKKFKEKPSLKIARKYVKQGYLWNSGIFLFSKKVFEEELKKYQNEIYNLYLSGDLEKKYEFLKSLSVDFGLLERSKRIFVVESNLLWDDIGSLDSLIKYVKNSNKIEINAHNNSSISKKTVCFIGIDDLIVVETNDALLICKKGQSQKVREVYKILKNKKV